MCFEPYPDQPSFGSGPCFVYLSKSCRVNTNFPNLMGNNVLVVGPPHTGKVSIAQLLTKDLDCSTIPSSTHSGLVYEHKITTKYFSAQVNILIEEYPDKRDGELQHQDILKHLSLFVDEFAKDEYVDLRDELDGVIFTLNLSELKGSNLVTALENFEKIKALFDEQELFYVVVGDGKLLSVEETEEIEDEAMQFGFEFVDLNQSGENEFREKLGGDRLVEIFESHEWEELDSEAADTGAIALTNLRPDDANQMTQNLLGEEPVDFEKFLQKIHCERARVSAMNTEEKEQVVKDIVNDLMKQI